MTENSTYKIKIFCTNCNFVGEAEIPLGKEIKDQPCPKCGCKTLHIKNEF